ncbi:hypothetical protein [Aminicella lysinilytica]|uniref:Uncharacterized protein n=1 Tax=Aminicella lysinilytica TaxID=433323 RepID=A0A4R6Q3L6_9FIRM|nr:hypothetical protein [Aminicella lysinilytica]NLD11536.1 hypothetical protein [Clostridiales bacterium]TDP56440.1 hypothetical protein EV211_11414 [Aminicella lysinilytica]
MNHTFTWALPALTVVLGIGVYSCTNGNVALSIIAALVPIAFGIGLICDRLKDK